MYDRERSGARTLALTLVPALGCAAAVLAVRAAAQSAAHRPASAGSHVAAHATVPAAGDVVATVNGERITREQVADDMLNAQTDKLLATEPVFQDRNQRLTAGSVGALVLEKMRAHPGQPVTVTHAELVDWLFKDKPMALYQTVERLIDQTAIEQAGRKAGIVVTQSDIDAQLKKTLAAPRKQYPNLSSTDSVMLKQLGVSPSFLRPIVRTQYTLDKMVRADIQHELGHPLSDADFIQARHILVMVQPNPGNTADNDKRFAEAKTKIDAIAADIKSGKTTFEKAAQENNQDATKFKGGDLGVIVRGMPGWDKDFVTAAFGTPAGATSQPVRSQFGWHLIRVDKTGKDLTAQEKQQALDQIVQQRINVRAQQIIASAKITNTIKPPANPAMMGMGAGQPR